MYYTSGKDIRLCTWIRKECPKCQIRTQFGLYEKSDINGISFSPYRYNKEYHIMCKQCSVLIPVDEQYRKKYYLTFSEKLKKKILSFLQDSD